MKQHAFYGLVGPWIVALFLFFPTLVRGQSKAGIQFRTGSMNSLYETARRSGKPVFVEIYSPTCHVCQSFLPIFEDKRVAGFYNSRFVNTKLDITSRETIAFLDRNRLVVPSLPLFLYFNGKGDLIHMAMSNNTAEEVIRHGTNALNPAVRSTTMRQRYERGERSPNFLIDYAMFAKVTKDTAANIRAMNDYAAQQSAASLASQTNWLVLQKLIMDVDNPLFQYLITHLDKFMPYGAQPVKTTAENILMSSLYSSRGNQYPAAKILKIRDQLIQIGIDSRVAANRTLLPEINAYFRAGQATKAANRMNDQIAQNQFSIQEYTYVARLFNGKSPDAGDAPSVVRWINRALPQAKSPQEQADLYFEMAEAYRRGGKIGEGLKAAEKSLELARTAKLDTKRHTQQVARLKS